jgi:hypothetical protein
VETQDFLGGVESHITHADQRYNQAAHSMTIYMVVKDELENEDKVPSLPLTSVYLTSLGHFQGLTLTFLSTRPVGLLLVIFTRPNLTSSGPHQTFHNKKKYENIPSNAICG